MSDSFNVFRTIIRTGGLALNFIIGLAYAQPLSGMDSSAMIIKQIVVPMTFLILFFGAFFVTLRDEFFSPKPRPISKDLNRAFIGFVIGQLKTFAG